MVSRPNYYAIHNDCTLSQAVNNLEGLSYTNINRCRGQITPLLTTTAHFLEMCKFGDFSHTFALPDIKESPRLYQKRRQCEAMSFRDNNINWAFYFLDCQTILRLI